MPYNGAGAFGSLGVPTFPAVSGTYILASYFNATMNDVFLGLSTALPRDGQAAPTANMPMGGFKWTGMGPGLNPLDSVNFGQVFNGGTFTSPIFIGTPTAPSPPLSTNTTQVATTDFVQSLVTNSLVPGAGAPMWVAATYAFGDVVWSPASLLDYRCAVTSLVSTVDPGINGASWVALNGDNSPLWSLIWS